MGTWGESNFENDGASDYLVALIDKLVDEVRHNLSDDKLNSSSFLEWQGEHKVIPAIDIIITLSVEYDCPSRVDSAISAEWRNKYLLAFDRDDSMYSYDFKIRRRKVIEETFDRLDNLIADWGHI